MTLIFLVLTIKATGFKSLRVNYREINQVTSKCQMDFLDTTCKKGLKLNIAIEFYVFKMVWVPNFRLNRQFWTKLTQKRVFLIQKRKTNGNHHRILHIWSNLGSKFNFISLDFLEQISQKFCWKQKKWASPLNSSSSN